jgi:uncharacterized membrane protein YtjA (UPF0391 family)
VAVRAAVDLAEAQLLRWALVFLALAVAAAGTAGVTSLDGPAMEAAKVLCVCALALFVVFVGLGAGAGRRVS